MVEAAGKYGRIVQAGTQCRSHKGIQDADRVPPLGQARPGVHGQGALLQAPRVDRPQVRRHRARGPRLRPLDRPGREEAVQPEPAALQLALVLEHRQRRPRQPGHPPDGPRPLGAGQERVPQDGAWPAAAGTATRTRPRRRTPWPSNFEFDDCLLQFEVRGLPTNDEAKVKIGDIFYGTEGVLAITSYTDWQTYIGPKLRTRPRRQRRRRPLRQFRRGGEVAATRSRSTADRGRPPLQRLLPPGEHRLPPRPQAAHQPLDRVVRRTTPRPTRC